VGNCYAALHNGGTAEPRRHEDTTGHNVFIRWLSCCLNRGGTKVMRKRSELLRCASQWWNHGGTKPQRGMTFSFAGAHEFEPWGMKVLRRRWW